MIVLEAYNGGPVKRDLVYKGKKAPFKVSMFLK